MKRRKFISLTGAGLAGSTLLSAAPIKIQSTPVRLTFGHGPDDSGTIQQVIEKFNEQYKGQISVRWQVMPRLSNLQHRRLVSDFNVESGEI